MRKIFFSGTETIFLILNLPMLLRSDKNIHTIYVASSWRNEFYPEVVEKLREAGHDVYDFRNPPSGGHGFKWSDISAGYMDWSPEEYRENMTHTLAERQFKNDIEAME